MHLLQICFIKGVILVIVYSSLIVHSSSDVSEDSIKWEKDEYDFIVVGSGSAGSIVAGRLAESGHHSVLLIEWGGLPHPDFEIPALALKHSHNKKYSNSYFYVKQDNAALASDGKVNHLHGKVLGGTATINGMNINRGSPQDFDNWSKLTGEPSWSYSEMLKYFKKFENYMGSYPTESRGKDGPITITRQKYAPGAEEWLDGAKELGFQVLEPNGPSLSSYFAPVDFTKKDGRRANSFTGYIKPLLKPDSTESLKPNFHLLINSEAKQVIFSGNKAIGVKVLCPDAKFKYFKAQKEIILSAGVIGTPLILLKSRVDTKSLSKAQLKLIEQLPIGKNFHDHVKVSLDIIFNTSSVVFDRKRDLTEETLEEFMKTGDGPYSTYAGNFGQAFLDSNRLDSPDNSSLNDLQINMVHGTLPKYAAFDLMLGSQPLAKGELEKEEFAVRWTIYSTRPKSRVGEVRLNQNGRPIIDYQYLNHKDDIKALANGIELMLKLCQETKTFQRVSCRIPKYPLKECKTLTYPSDEYWECYIQQVSSSAIHSAGTCRMGKGDGDPNAVVDPELMVIGVERLRVADASIMPRLVNANPIGSIYAIGEKAAELILEVWGT